MSLWNAKSVNPDTVTPAEIAEIAADFFIDLNAAVPDDFLQPGQTYHRHGDTFRCAAVGMRFSSLPDSRPAAIGYLPVNIGGESTWEFAMFDWLAARGWTKAEA